MATKKHTIKEVTALLRSCLSMLDALQGVSTLLGFRGRYYKKIAHLFVSGSSIAEAWCYDDIVFMYNDINKHYLSL